MQRQHCQVFEQVVGRLKPRLSHPTSARFSLEEWKSNIPQEIITEEDANLIRAAAFIGAELSLLRDHKLDKIFDKLDLLSAIRMGVASVNRGSIILAAKQATTANLETEGVTYVDALAKPKIEGFAGKMSIDSAMTSLIDGLPHWLFQASLISSDLPKPPKETEPDCFSIHQNAALFLSLERSLKDVWQEILWEPWIFDLDALKLSPRFAEDAKKWIAWQLREDALLSQAMYFDKAMGFKRSHHEAVLKRTVSKVIRTPRGLRIRIGSSSEKQRSQHYWLMEMLERSYLSTFLDFKPENRSFTMRDLLKAWFILCDFARAWSITVGKTETDSIADIERLACELPVSRWSKLLQECTGFTQETVSEIMQLFTVNPLDTSDTFKSGFWHRPFVCHPSQDRLMCLTGVLKSANLIYTMEHWLRDTDLLVKFENTSLGIKYETDTRNSLSKSLRRNGRLTDVAFVEKAIAKTSDDGEEIDLLFRVGKKIILGEVKCLVRPADPIQRYNHIEKLKGAAEQARRKVNWLRKQTELLGKLFGREFVLAEHELIPVVVLNSSPGMGVVIDGVIFTEKKWLELILGDNSYSSGLIVNAAPNSTDTIFTQLYSDQTDFESKLRTILSEPAGLKKYLNSLVKNTFSIPTSMGGFLVCEHFELDHRAMVQSEMGLTI